MPFSNGRSSADIPLLVQVIGSWLWYWAVMPFFKIMWGEAERYSKKMPSLLVPITIANCTSISHLLSPLTQVFTGFIVFQLRFLSSKRCSSAKGDAMKLPCSQHSTTGVEVQLVATVDPQIDLPMYMGMSEKYIAGNAIRNLSISSLLSSFKASHSGLTKPPISIVIEWMRWLLWTLILVANLSTISRRLLIFDWTTSMLYYKKIAKFSMEWLLQCIILFHVVLS